MGQHPATVRSVALKFWMPDDYAAKRLAESAG
jgi:hypothetical protein